MQRSLPLPKFCVRQTMHVKKAELNSEAGIVAHLGILTGQLPKHSCYKLRDVRMPSTSDARASSCTGCPIGALHLQRVGESDISIRRRSMAPPAHLFIVEGGSELRTVYEGV